MTTATVTLGRKLPNLSCMLKVGQLRYIQSTMEEAPLRNPDALVHTFLSPMQRWECHWRGHLLLNRLRTDPFYYYLLARTRYYDQVVLDSLRGGVRWVVNVGCGSDTRAHRHADALQHHSAGVLECDQAAAIAAKRSIARARLPDRHIAYLPIDLNDMGWPTFERWLDRHAGRDILVLMEGVSPYVDELRFAAFLRMLRTQLSPRSRVAYDFKVAGLRGDVDAGSTPSDATTRTFRLPTDASAVDAFHAVNGWRVSHLETSAALTRRLLPTLASISSRPLFEQDGLVQLGSQTPLR